MKKHICLFITAFLILALTACTLASPAPTPDTFLEEELAEQAFATAKAKKTQRASRISPYAEISDEEQTYLAFWFNWNNETVFLPIAKSRISESKLASCQFGPETALAIGELVSGQRIVESNCVPDEQALENAAPTIKIPGYFEDSLQTDELNIIDLGNEPAGNLSEVVTIIIENDLLGSGDLTLSLQRTDGPNGEPADEIETAQTYSLPAEMLQMKFSDEQLGEFEHADDVVYELRRAFTWKILERLDELSLSAGDENWFVLIIDEDDRELETAYIQIKGVGEAGTP